jgi:hypothetical protein
MEIVSDIYTCGLIQIIRHSLVSSRGPSRVTRIRRVDMKSYPYQVLGTKEREESSFFMLDSILRSRIETGEETIDDEDVNIYLAGLLHSFLDRSFFKTYGDTISRYDSQIYDLAEVPGDPGVRFRVYKGNADYSLMAAAVFEEEQGAECETERGKRFYGIASACHARICRKKTGVATVLEKLSERFETYRNILSYMRGEYLKLLRRFTKGEMFHLEREVHAGALTGFVPAGRNHFLDAYSDWMKTGSEAARDRVNVLGEALRKADPEFAFAGI